VDYRDPWSGHAWPRWRRGVLAQWFARRIEKRMLRASAARVLNTPAMRAAFQHHFPWLPPESNHVIPNGFDAPAGTAPPPAGGPLTVVHAGEIFTGRSLVPVLSAAARLAARRPDRAIRVVTYGKLPAFETERIRAAGLEGFIEVRERIPFAELFPELQRAHLLLAVVGEHMVYSTPYKVYDYMASGRPILGLAPRGAALFELLSDSGAGHCFDPADIDGIEQALERALDGDAPLRARVERFRWSNLAQQYRSVIEQVAAADATHPPIERIARRTAVTEPPEL
jgi:glycosyltransferase involved in cell wall biosynthesis